MGFNSAFKELSNLSQEICFLLVSAVFFHLRASSTAAPHQTVCNTHRCCPDRPTDRTQHFALYTADIVKLNVLGYY